MHFHVQIPPGLWKIMRITCSQLMIALAVTCITLAHDGRSQQLLDRTVTFSLQQISLEEALLRLEKEAFVKFVYSKSIVNTSRVVHMEVRNAPVRQILDKLLVPAGIDYRIVRDRIVLKKVTKEKSGSLHQEPESDLILPSRDKVVFASLETSVRGVVRDDKGDGLPGVSIVLKGTNQGTVTDENGAFVLNLSEKDAVLIFSFVGYVSKEITLGSQTSLDVVLLTDTKALEEVVVVGYGTQSRETITTSISKLDTQVLENIPYANAASALQGALSGVQVQSTSGQPGAAPRIIVRGGTSINNPNGASPLYIIDGIIRANMNDISPDDIESLQVLTDAAATAIYGARASNGVVIITTKTGKAGKTRITYSYDLSSSTVAKTYDVASARDYITYSRVGTMATARKNPAVVSQLTQAIGYGTGNNLTNSTAFTTQFLTPENEHKLNEGWESMPDPLDPSKTIIFKGTDWQDKLFQTATSHNHHVSLSGGTEKATFNAALGYLTNDGIAITTKFDRLTFNFNGELQVKENVKVFGRTMYTVSSNNQVYDLAQIFYRSAGLAPTAKFTFEDGSLAPGSLRDSGNPVYHLNNDVRENSSENLTLAVGGRWDILPGLSFEPQVSLYKVTNDGYTFIPSYYNGVSSFVTTRSATSSYSKLRQTQVDAVFTYDKLFRDSHHLSAKAGFSYFGRETYSLSAAGQGAATDLIPTLNASPTPVSVNGAVSNQVILGYFSRVNYDYRQKYLVSLNARYDGASNLGANHQWGFFPGISAGWNLHNEEFWKAIPENLLRLKLRASYGVNGNISGLSDFQSQGEYGVGDRYLGMSAIQNTVMPNNDLKWEQSKTFDLGMDINAFNNRISVMFDYYHRVTDNLLTTLSLPASTGFSSVFTNLGSLQNRGVELEIGAQVFPASSDLQWTVSLNASKTRHKILTLPDNGTENNRVGGFYVWDQSKGDYAWLGGLQEGGRIGDHYAHKQLGVYSTDEEAKSAPTDLLIAHADKRSFGGDAIWLDSDANGVIDERDRVYMGNSYPVWNGGISNSLSYKNFNFLIRMDYTTGHTIYNYARIFLNGRFIANANFMQEMVSEGWSQQGDNAKMVQYLPGANYNMNRGASLLNTATNSVYYEKGDFLCLRELTLSYTVPSKIIRSLKISNVRFNLTGSNLRYFTGYKGLNPEDGGRDDGRYPIPRNITFGASVSF